MIRRSDTKQQYCLISSKVRKVSWILHTSTIAVTHESLTHEYISIGPIPAIDTVTPDCYEIKYSAGSQGQVLCTGTVPVHCT